MPKHSGLIIATTTLYKNVSELRFQLANEMVEVAKNDGYRVVIVDGSPIPEITETLLGLGAEVFPQLHKGIGSGRREVFFHAWEVAVQEDCPVIIWTEPEKVGLISQIGKVVKPIQDGEADIVIPARSEISWMTWPKFQVASERAANKVYNRVLGTNGFDPMFGPVAFSVASAGYFVLCHSKVADVPDTYVQHYAPIIAKRDGKRVVSVEIDMSYPPQQRAEEEELAKEKILEKRHWQMESLTGAYRAISREQ